MRPDRQTCLNAVKDWEKQTSLVIWDSCVAFLLYYLEPKFLDLDRLDALAPRLLQLDWRGEFPTLQAALQNFGHVAQDLVTVFRRHAVLLPDHYLVRAPIWSTQAFHRKFLAHRDSTPAEKARSLELRAAYSRHVDEVRDLTLELTRAANLVIDRVREDLWSEFREKHGHVGILLADKTLVQVQYSANERSRPQPYPGLEAFLVERSTRDMSAGTTPGLLGSP